MHPPAPSPSARRGMSSRTPPAGSTSGITSHMRRSITIPCRARVIMSTVKRLPAGVEPYGGCLDFVVADNTISQVRTGISSWEIADNTSGAYALEPTFFNLYTGNNISYSTNGLNVGGPWWDSSGNSTLLPGHRLFRQLVPAQYPQQSELRFPQWLRRRGRVAVSRPTTPRPA